MPTHSLLVLVTSLHLKCPFPDPLSVLHTIIIFMADFCAGTFVDEADWAIKNGNHVLNFVCGSFQWT